MPRPECWVPALLSKDQLKNKWFLSIPEQRQSHQNIHFALCDSDGGGDCSSAPEKHRFPFQFSFKHKYNMLLAKHVAKKHILFLVLSTQQEQPANSKSLSGEVSGKTLKKK